MHCARLVSALIITGLLAVLSVPSFAAANINTEPRLDDPFTGVLTLIVINFGTDLLLVAVAVYGASYFTHGKTGNTAADAGTLTALVILAGGAVAIIGGVIDFALLYERVDDHYALKAFSLDAVLMATALIYGAVAASLRVIVRIRSTISLAAAAFIAPLSPIAWFIMSLTTGAAVMFWVMLFITVSWIFAIVTLLLLHRFQKRAASGEFDRAYEGGTA